MHWKRNFSGMLAATLLIGTMPAAMAWEAPAVDGWQEAGREGVAARFFVGSDTHIGRGGADEKVANALDVFYQVDPQADGVLFVGDLTDSGSEAQYDRLMSIINESDLGAAGKVVLSMGNHDMGGGIDRFESKTGQESSEVLDLGGITVIKMTPVGGSNYTGDYDMVKAALEQADPDEPVIVMGHHGIRDTAYVTNEWYGNYGEGTDRDLTQLFEQYPQVIHISGHSHSTLEDARSIYQDDGYTAIQDSTIGAYFENESGKVDPVTGQASTYPYDADYSSQALRVDVMEDGTVEIYRMDLTEGTYMYESEPWVFDGGNDGERPYTEERTSSAAPSFAEGSVVTVSDVTGDSMVVHFPTAAEATGDNADMIHEYWITLTNTADQSKVVRKVFSDYYKEDRQSEMSVKITDLNGNTTYSIQVEAVTSFDAISNPIVAEEDVTTGAGYVPTYPAEAIFDVDFAEKDNGADAAGHTQTVFGEPSYRVDEELNRTVAVFDGQNDGLRYSMTSEDYAKLTKNYTVELFYKPLDNKNNNPMGNTQVSGFCFEQKGGTNTLQFWSHIGGSYKTPEVDVAANEWNHIVGTYDGENVKIYLNGELKDSVPASGSMKEPPHYLFLGGDTTSGGQLEYQANCEIALARVYTGTMTAEDVQKAYEAAVTPVEEPEETAVTVSVSGPEKAGQNARVSYTFALNGDVTGLKTVHLTFDIQGQGMFTDTQALEAAEGFQLLGQKKTALEDGVRYDVVLSYGLSDAEAMAELKEMLELYVRTTEQSGEVQVTLRNVLVNDGVQAQVDEAASAVHTAVSDLFDVDGDGDLDLNDIAAAQDYYQAKEGDANWTEAQKADVNQDGAVNLQDLVELAKAYLDVA